MKDKELDEIRAELLEIKTLLKELVEAIRWGRIGVYDPHYQVTPKFPGSPAEIT